MHASPVETDPRPPIPAWSGLNELRPELRRRLAKRCPYHVDVEEIIQETLIRAARFRSTLQSQERLGGWVLRIAWNVLRERRRRSRREHDLRVPSMDLDANASSEGEPYAIEPTHVWLDLDGVLVGRERALELLGEELATLTPDDQVVLGAYYWGATSCHEAARTCGVRRELVKTRLFRARRRLLRAMRRRLFLETRKHPTPENELC
jgi:RNA polymerase sigma factor (sigma-70 family)